MPRYYPIFNLADSAIVCGGILTVILAMRGYHLDGTRSVTSPCDERSATTHGADTPGTAGAGRRPPGRARSQPTQRGRRSRERRLVHVPEGLDGERLDAALARMFGFSRTGAAELIAAGDVLVDGRRR